MGSCLRARLRNIWRRLRRGALWCSFVFIFNILFASNLDMAVPRHHGAVGGFFSAPQERADYTSFEGGNKSGALAEDC